MLRKLIYIIIFRFFLAFDKATGKTDNWPKQDENNFDKVSKIIRSGILIITLLNIYLNTPYITSIYV